ncbi:MAG TPA: DUF1592 domain-containing protein [Pseudomonadales bacterium]|nr:DUF1592 domain-containing protein [Pseudomonadales bacterium]
MRTNPLTDRGPLRRPWSAAAVLSAALLLTGASACAADATAAEDAYGPADAVALLDDYCDRCHNDLRMSGNWSLSMVDPEEIARGENLEAWEKIFRMTREGAMPPPDRDQPTRDERAAFTTWLQATLDGHAAANPDPGRTTLRRLNRAEYANAVRDLLAIEVDLADALPADDSGYGFDNIADVLSVSSTLMDRYFAVAGKVSRLAVGHGPATPVLTTYQVPKDGSILNQGVPSWDVRMSEHLPLDSRGGAAFAYYAPRDGLYDISGWLNANTNNEVDRLEENHHALRVRLDAGPHMIGMSFRKRLRLDESVQTLRNDTDIVPLPTAPPEDLALDFVVDGARVGTTQVPSYYMSPRFAQKNFPRDLLQLDVEGPFEATGPGDTPSRRRIFRCRPDAGAAAAAERACATRIVADLARQAWRRPVAAADLEPLMSVYAAARQDADFEGAIATAVQALLVSPSFLFLVEQDPPSAPPGTVHAISDTEFAARLALFLWSSLPDAELLDLAERGDLRRPDVLRTQLDRMLADPKARALTDNFAGQWLFLRNLDHHRPDVMAFPDFDVRLRAAMRRETEMFFAALVRDDGSLLDFLDADYSYLDERLAEHYGMDGVQGPALRRVALPPEAGRGGLLGQASLLTLTSYGNHTSVVKRGHWILDSLLAAPPPPPPPDIPALVAEKEGKALNAREQMAMHREDPACASCHVKMDPLGLALEKYDAVGARRILDAGRPIDASAELPDGTTFEGLEGLQTILLARRDQFTRAFTEQLLTYALGRGPTARDRPTIRAIASAAAEDDYRLQRVILEIVGSEPFNYRRTPEA